MRTGKKLGFDLWLKEEYNRMDAKIPGTADNPASQAKITTLENLCVSHGIDLNAWVCGNGKTLENLTELDVAKMLNAIKKKFGDE
ncbi:MAG: hypothetical protein QM793_03495 [Muricomes sp.]